MMNISTVRALTFGEAAAAFPLLDSLDAWRRDHAGDGDALVVEAPQSAWPRELGVNARTLLVALPDDCEPHLGQIAGACVTVYNDTSDDLLSCRTFMALEADALAVDMDAWALGPFPDGSPGHKFFLCLVAGSRVLLMKHEFDAEEWEGLMCGLQAACCASGPNYSPYRLWAPEQLQAAAQGVSGSAPYGSRRRLVCRVLTAKQA